MDYKMEELVPIVGWLAEKYTGSASTSVTYEKAEQLMEAVLYCIREVELSGQDSLALAEGISARQAYELGAAYVEKKTKLALDLYNEISQGFAYYENRCLYETFIKGLPEFFKWYDIKFEPQNTILTLDYPVLKDLSGYTGIDRIYEFVSCIRLEQIFLRKFPEDYVIDVLFKYNHSYKDMVDNLCEIVFTAVIGYILAKKPILEGHFEEVDYMRIQEWLSRADKKGIRGQLENIMRTFLHGYYGDDGELLEYFAGLADCIAVRLKRAAACRDFYSK